MKHSVIQLLIIGLFSYALAAQDEMPTGLDGDNFSLEGALQMFKKAESPEAFEKALNSKDNYVNNLDLNEDGQTDYVKVLGYRSDDAHVFVLQVDLDAKNSQDIAVIELEKDGPKSAIVQIIGDEDVYGETQIVEPFDIEATEKGNGPSPGAEYTKIVVNVWAWPIVRFVYIPSYIVWTSPWYWNHYPGWWSPWRPLSYTVFNPYTHRYRRGFHVVNTHRVVRAHRVYIPKRRTTTVVASRTRVVKSRTVNTRTGVKKTTVKKGKGVHKSGQAGRKVTRSKTVKKGGKSATVKKTKTQKIKKKKG